MFTSTRVPIFGRLRGGAISASVVLAMLRVPAVAAQTSSAPTPRPEVATLGTCRFGASAAVPNCRVAYRAYGRLSAQRDNVVLIPTFFGGRSEDHRFMLGAYVDTTRYHVIIVDALADGYSSSPSTTPAGPAAFADLTIGDMVDLQYRLLTEHLGIRHVRAVVGISMGGFQAFEWAVRYPTFMDATVPLFGTPRLTPYDRLVFETWRRSTEQLGGPWVDVDSAWVQASRLEVLFMRTPRFANDSGDAALARSVRELATSYRAAGWSLADYAAQIGAIGRHDVSTRFGGDLTRAAAAVRSRLLIVWATTDMLVNPGPPSEFARLVRADTLSVPSDCGHAVFWCEPQRIGRVVRDFVDRAPILATESRGAQPHAARRARSATP